MSSFWKPYEVLYYNIIYFYFLSFTLVLPSLLVENYFIYLIFLTQMSRQSFITLLMFFTILIKFTLSTIYQNSWSLALAPLAHKGSSKSENLLVKIFNLKQKEILSVDRKQKTALCSLRL